MLSEIFQSLSGCAITLSLICLWRFLTFLSQPGNFEKLSTPSSFIREFILGRSKSGTKSISDLPGPWGLPYFGSMFSLGSLPHEVLASMVPRFGDMFRLKAGCRRFVVISSAEKLNEIAHMFPEQLCGKPRTFTTDQLSLGAHNDILLRWKRRRAHMNSGLKYLERYSALDIINSEVGHIVDFLEKCEKEGESKDIRHDISFFVSRVIYRLSYGAEPDLPTQKRLMEIVHALPDYTSTIGSFSPFDLLPRLRHVYKQRFSKFVNFNRDLSGFCRDQKEKFRQSYLDKSVRCCDGINSGSNNYSNNNDGSINNINSSQGSIDVNNNVKSKESHSLRYCDSRNNFLISSNVIENSNAASNDNCKICKGNRSESCTDSEFKQVEIKDYAAPPADLFEHFRRRWERMSETDKAKFGLTEDTLYDSIEDIMRAGTESSSLVIQWFLLFVSAFPHVQQKMQKELDAYMSSKGKRLPEADDVANLPYCQAAMTETYRYACLNPFLKRELTGDVAYRGYAFPRNTVLLYNQWAINNDEQVFPEPREFRPERFLDSQGQYDETLTKMFMPFGFGRRRCIGVFTGKTVCLLTALSLVYKFNVSLEHGPKSADLTPISGIGLSPKAYKLKMSSR